MGSLKDKREAERARESRRDSPEELAEEDSAYAEVL